MKKHFIQEHLQFYETFISSPIGHFQIHMCECFIKTSIYFDIQTLKMN